MEKPNVILINCDDLGYGDLGCYGSKINKTPAIDRLASEGIIFSSFYMASSLCSPSRGAMLTGCYPRRIGFDRFDNGFGTVLFPGDAEGLSPSEITIANILKDAGYKVTSFNRSVEAIEFYRNNYDDFDLILTDIAMPELTGVAIAQEISTIKNDIPIIFCTGYNADSTVNNLNLKNVTRVLTKPILSRDLLRAIRQALDQK